MGFAADERSDFCDAALAVRPTAPTLCAGWTTVDLVAHVWTRENDPLSMPGIALPALAGFTERRNLAAVDRWGFRGLVELVRQGPPATSVFALPGMDEKANTVELFVHTEDIRRPNGLPRRARTPGFEELAWQRVKGMARLFFRRAGSGVVLEREDTGESFRARPGTPNVVVVGQPSELLLFTFGRTRHADVRLLGPDAPVSALVETHTAL